ncbi:MAG: hypothetical protein M1819_003683 [Sarea resinae]|nr:MAG: hypothetical protein M1819_003683 [Sarea resinae]
MEPENNLGPDGRLLVNWLLSGGDRPRPRPQDGRTNGYTEFAAPQPQRGQAARQLVEYSPDRDVFDHEGRLVLPDLFLNRGGGGGPTRGHLPNGLTNGLTNGLSDGHADFSAPRGQQRGQAAEVVEHHSPEPDDAARGHEQGNHQPSPQARQHLAEMEWEHRRVSHLQWMSVDLDTLEEPSALLLSNLTVLSQCLDEVEDMFDLPGPSLTLYAPCAHSSTRFSFRGKCVAKDSSIRALILIDSAINRTVISPFAGADPSGIRYAQTDCWRRVEDAAGTPQLSTLVANAAANNMECLFEKIKDIRKRIKGYRSPVASL